ncbi:MAG: hypothetical protein ACK5OB_17655 [Pirellula sp.]
MQPTPSSSQTAESTTSERSNTEAACAATREPVCPVCGGRLIEIRAKFQCSKCHRICETCCEGGRG